MGNCQTKSIEDTRHEEIEEEIQQDKNVQVRKLLLLGAGECGKTTILKQIRLLHDTFSENEMLCYKPVISSFIITSMLTIAETMPSLGISFEHTEREEDVQILRDIIFQEEDQHPIGPELCLAIKNLWSDKGIKKCYKYKDQIHVNDAAEYFFDEIDRISEPSYQPTMQDILNVRSATLGVQEVRFFYKKTLFRIFDVGGQKSQRRKWMHVFDDVNAVIFITAISEFNQVMREDNNTNRLQDSLTLFTGVSNNEYFVKISLILFLNKKDLFEEKIKQTLSIKSAFSDYGGPTEYEASMEFISKKFADSVINKKRKLYTHQTCANDTNQVKVVLVGVTDIIINKNIKDAGV